MYLIILVAVVLCALTLMVYGFRREFLLRRNERWNSIMHDIKDPPKPAVATLVDGEVVASGAVAEPEAPKPPPKPPEVLGAATSPRVIRRRKSDSPELPKREVLDPARSAKARMERLGRIVGAARGNLYRLPFPARRRTVDTSPGKEMVEPPRLTEDFLMPDPKLEEVRIFEVDEDGFPVFLMSARHVGGRLIHFFDEEGGEIDLALFRKLWIEMARERRVAPSSGRHYLYELLEYYAQSNRPGAWVAIGNLEGVHQAEVA